MDRYENIKNRYVRGYITDSQLNRYVKLAWITEEQADEIRNLMKENQE